mmetsp:Transcript_36682/g.105614  ORF Transcript_36682/g.105614 Transcript_36682/m.105614 type:complete len:678 (-) Transcript_36682:168-2201(-)
MSGLAAWHSLSDAARCPCRSRVRCEFEPLVAVEAGDDDVFDAWLCTDLVDEDGFPTTPARVHYTGRSTCPCAAAALIIVTVPLLCAIWPLCHRAVVGPSRVGADSPGSMVQDVIAASLGMERRSCSWFGCGGPVDASRSCQCHAGCAAAGTCCNDFAHACGAMAMEVAPHSMGVGVIPMTMQRVDNSSQRVQKSSGCGHYGCSGNFDPTRQCQCNVACVKHGSCCDDFRNVCIDGFMGPRGSTTSNVGAEHDGVSVSPALERDGCDRIGCGGAINASRICQCHSGCVAEGTCCSDFAHVCYEAGHTIAKTSTTLGARHPSLEPDACGRNGCGGDFAPGRSCQCNANCAAHGSCCGDFGSVCLDGSGGARGRCAETGEDCELSQCCAEPKALCFRRGDGRAKCMYGCVKLTGPVEKDSFQHPEMCDILGEPFLPSLFCFAAMISRTKELGLVRSQQLRGEGIFACDDFMLFSEVEVHLGPDNEGRRVITRALPELVSPTHIANAMTSSWLNQRPFSQAWDYVAKSAVSRSHDFVVKADPDTVLFPAHLKVLLRSERLKVAESDAGSGVYLQNCFVGGDLQLYGSLEVLSRSALHTYRDRGDRCNFLKSSEMGEDMWMQRCLNATGVAAVRSRNVLIDSYCPAIAWSSDPCVFGWAAYHPLKSTEQWWRCWHQVASSIA